MRQPTLYHLVNLSNKLAHQLHYLKDHIHLHGNAPVGGSEEAHLWTPEEEQEANWMAERAMRRRPTAQHPNDEYLHIQGNRPAEQYASRGDIPGPGNTFDYPTEIYPADIGHPNVGQALGHGLQARDMNRRNSAIGGRIKAHTQAAKRFRNAGDAFGLAPQTLSPASRRKERRRAGQMPHFGDYYAGTDIPIGYAESPKDVSDFADRARRPQSRRRAARVLEHAAEENTRHGYGNHPAVMRMRDDAARQEREAERESHPAPRYSRYSDSTSNPFHSISYGRQATCGQCNERWYIATDSIDLVCPRCGANSTKYAVTDQPGIYGPATAAPAPGGHGPRRLPSGHDPRAEEALPMDRMPPRRPLRPSTRPDPRYPYPDTGPKARRNPNYARYADNPLQQTYIQDRRLHENRLRQVFPEWDELHPHDQQMIWNKTYRTGPARHGVGVGHPTNEEDLAGWRDEMNQRQISAHHDPFDLSKNHATSEFDDYLADTHEQSSPEEWASHVDRMEQESGANRRPYNPPEQLPEGFEEPTQAWHEHIRRANQPTQAARYSRTDYHGRLCRLRERLAALRQPTMYDDEMDGGMDEEGMSYADNVSGIGQDERSGYNTGEAEPTQRMFHGHGSF